MIERIFVENGVKMVQLEEMLRKELNRAGFTKTEIIKTPLVTRIIVSVVKPSFAIGKSGQNIRQLTELIGKHFKIENPQIEIKEIEKPDLDALAVVNKIKSLVERGFSWRSVVYRTMRDIQAAGAQGVEFLVSGKLAGKGGRKRKVRISWGYMKKVGFQTSLVDFGKAAAYTKSGAIGIKIKIVRPETVFPDKFNLKEHVEMLKQKQAAQKEKETAEETTEKPAETAEALDMKKEQAKPQEETEKKEGTQEKTKAETKPSKKEEPKKEEEKNTPAEFAEEMKAEKKKHSAKKQESEKSGKKD